MTLAWDFTGCIRRAADDVMGMPHDVVPDRSDVPYRVLSVRAMAIAGVVLLLLAAAAVTVLLLAYGKAGDQQMNQLEAIKTAGTLVLGAGGAVGLLLAARRQRSTEIALTQTDRNHAAVEADAASRRITELYTAAADQLGSGKAPVRLAGLYALERVAQDNPAQRQTIVNVICAYLRMPFDLPSPSDGDALVADDDTVDVDLTERRNWQQEREVRLTAQRILTDHLHCNSGSDSPIPPTFWADIDLDLTGAVLINFAASHCRARRVNFTGASFSSHAYFEDATFSGEALFDQVHFSMSAVFNGASFSGSVSFIAASFNQFALFSRANFGGPAVFEAANFGAGESRFTMASFSDFTSFRWASFLGHAVFDEASFSDGVMFGEVGFSNDARFGRTGFSGNASFIAASFLGNAVFEDASFRGHVEFDGASFRGPAIFTEVSFSDSSFQGVEFVGGHVPPEVVQFMVGKEPPTSTG